MKAGNINTGAILKENRSILGFDFYHYFMIENINKENFEIVHLEKTITCACCKIIKINFSALNQNVFMNFINGVILCKNDPLNEYEIKALQDRVEEYSSKPSIPYYVKSNKGFNCETFLEYLRSGEKKPSLEVQKFEERYGKLGSSTIIFIDKALLLFYTTRYIFEKYLHVLILLRSAI